MLVNSHVGLLFVDFERPGRLRVNGTAHVSADDALRSECPGAEFRDALPARDRAEEP